MSDIENAGPVMGPEALTALLATLSSINSTMGAMRDEIKELKKTPVPQREVQDSLTVAKAAMKKVWEQDLSARFKGDVPFNLKDVIGYAFNTVAKDVNIAARTLSINAAVSPFSAPALYPERGIGENWTEKRPADLKQVKLVHQLLQANGVRTIPAIEKPGVEYVAAPMPPTKERKTDEQLAHEVRERLEAELAVGGATVIESR